MRPIGCFREEPTTSSQPAHGSCNVGAVKAKPMLTLPAILFAMGATQAAAAANINGSTTPAPLPAQEQQGARLQNATLALKALFAASCDDERPAIIPHPREKQEETGR
jgi:hypothetical protein